MPEPEPPRRGLICANPVPAENGGGMLLVCDCGTATHLVIDWEPGAAGKHEIAVTCDGCGTPHWVTVTIGAGDG